MATISFTKKEIEALFLTALNMQDDVENYFSYRKDIEKFSNAYNSAMEKLAIHIKEEKNEQQ